MSAAESRRGETASVTFDRERLCELGAGTPDRMAQEFLDPLTPESITAPAAVADRRMGLACIAGLWLLYDFLDRSHEVSQSLETVEGSYWHGIMHRREGDFENAKYWFRRAGRHAIHAELAAEAARLASTNPTDPAAHFLREQQTWDPNRFVDLCCDCVRGKASCVALCRSIQRREWQLLYDYCAAAARGR